MKLRMETLHEELKIRERKKKGSKGYKLRVGMCH